LVTAEIVCDDRPGSVTVVVALMDFRILGPIEALDEGREVALGGSRQRALLAVLLLHAGETLSSDRLIDALWGESPPAGAPKALQVQVSRLRKALGPADMLVTRDHGYRLELDPERLDASRFERGVAEGGSELAGGRPERAASVLEEALSLWRGPPLADLAYERFAQREIARLEELRATALEQLFEAKLALGRHAEVVGELQGLIREHPYRERLRAQLMLALYRSDRQADALQAYQDARSKLVEELGIEPGERLRELEKAVLAHDPELGLGAAPAARSRAGRDAALRIALLGAPRVERGGLPVTFETRKAMALLTYLAVAERPRPRAALCALLWPSQEADRARGALRRTLSTLRKDIGDEWIETAGDSIALRRGPGLELDIEHFRALAADHASVESLREAAALFSGEFLEGFSLRDSPDFDDWQVREAGALERELTSALRRLVELLVVEGKFEQAIPSARRWLELDPLNEPAHRALIRLYAWSGDRASALEQYRTCVRTLTHELGVAPLEETATLYEQVNDGSLAPPAAPQAPPPPPAAKAEAPPELPLVGRADDLAALLDAHAAARPDGRLAVIEGEAGIGKTRLAHELMDRARTRGAVVLSAGCYDDEAGLPYGPVVELLRDAAKGPGFRDLVPPQRLADAALLLPELAASEGDLRALLPLEGPGAQVRLLEGVAAVIGAACQRPEPGIVFVDDVHAADVATLDAIAYLGRRLTGRSLLLVLAWRSEGVPPGHRLRRLTVDLARNGRALIVRPGRLSDDEVATLVRAVRLDSPEDDLEQRLYVESEGLPLFVAEYLAALHAGYEQLEDTLPPEVRDLLDARVGGLDDVARQVLGAAAAIGRSFDLDTARHASGRSDEETVAALEDLVGEGLVRELPGAEPAYDFSHQKLRERVYEQTGLARRRLLHARIAAALSRRRLDGENAATVAQHLRLAGDHAGAAEQYRLAAEDAAALHAHADALDHLEAALALGHPDAAGLQERIGDLRTLVGDYRGALASYESAAAHCEPAARAAIEQKLGGVHHRRGEWARAEARFLAALEAGPGEERGLRARIQADLGLTLHHAGRPARAKALASEALALAEAATDRRAQAQAHNMLGVLARNEGEPKRAVEQLERSLELARELDDVPAQTAALNNLALVKRDAGDLLAALELSEKALALCARYGDRHRQAALENNLADLHHAAGHEDEAMAHLKRAVSIFSEVGADDATRLPEIWKLVSW
jgi:DNA-binding SARP family transcriptional activator